MLCFIRSFVKIAVTDMRSCRWIICRMRWRSGWLIALKTSAAFFISWECISNWTGLDVAGIKAVYSVTDWSDKVILNSLKLQYLAGFCCDLLKTVTTSARNGFCQGSASKPDQMASFKCLWRYAPAIFSACCSCSCDLRWWNRTAKFLTGSSKLCWKKRNQQGKRFLQACKTWPVI